MRNASCPSITPRPTASTENGFIPSVTMSVPSQSKKTIFWVAGSRAAIRRSESIMASVMPFPGCGSWRHSSGGSPRERMKRM
ncbi:hypothetical protein EBZ80_03440 [bacterium]|nr:hypothetical protein [bacterium]